MTSDQQLDFFRGLLKDIKKKGIAIGRLKKEGTFCTMGHAYNQGKRMGLTEFEWLDDTKILSDKDYRSVIGSKDIESVISMLVRKCYDVYDKGLIVLNDDGEVNKIMSAIKLVISDIHQERKKCATSV